MIDANEVRSVVLEAVRQNNELLPDDKQVTVAVETTLFGKNAALDSLGLVNLIVAVEQALGDKYGQEITLASEKAMSRKNSPFKTIGSLADYAFEVLTGAADA